MGRHKNVIIGSPDDAALIVTAHYDTGYNQVLQSVLTARNWGLYIAWQFCVLFLLFAISLGMDYLAGALNVNPQGRAIVFVASFLLLL